VRGKERSDQRNDDRQHWTHQSVRRMAMVLNEREVEEATGQRNLERSPQEKIQR
jgi:hypothetical protein